MHPQFGLEAAVGEFAFDQNGGAGNTCLIARLDGDHFGLVARFFGKAEIHAQKHVGPVIGFRATRAGVKTDDRVVAVERARQQDQHFQRIDTFGHGIKLGLEFFCRRVGGVFHDEFLQGLQVGCFLLEILEGIKLGADGVGLADDFLRGLGIVPKPGIGHLGLVGGELIL